MKNKYKLTLYFDTEIGLKNFKAWYLDGGGEQFSNYYSEDWGDDWMKLKAPYEACPECEFYSEDLVTHLDTNKIIKITCANCNHSYKFKNLYL